MNAITKTTAGTATMSSLTIAQACKKAHRHVLRDIRETLAAAKIDAAQFCAAQKYGNNNTREIFELPRRECDLVVSGYSVPYRLAIIDRWRALEAEQAAAAVPTLSNTPLATPAPTLHLKPPFGPGLVVVDRSAAFPTITLRKVVEPIKLPEDEKGGRFAVIANRTCLVATYPTLREAMLAAHEAISGDGAHTVRVFELVAEAKARGIEWTTASPAMADALTDQFTRRII